MFPARAVLTAALSTGALLLGTTAPPAAPSLPATRYVSVAGQDAGDCTQAPCGTFQYASGHAHPGDTVLVASGTYGPQQIAAVGTLEQPITITASGPVTITRPLPLTAASQSTWLLRIANSDYLTVSGFSVIGAKGQPGYDQTKQPYGGEVEVENHGADAGAGITISGLTVRDANNTCIKLEDHEPDARLIGNTVVNCGSSMPAEGRLDHGLYTSGPDTLISGNTAIGGTGWGIQAWPTGGGSVEGTTIDGNTVAGNASGGIVTGETPVTITNNVLHDNRGSAITVEDYYHTPLTGTVDLVAGNVLYHNGSPSDYSTASVMLDVRPPGRAVITNDTLYHDAGAAVGSLRGLGSGFAAPFNFTRSIVVADPTAYGAPRRGLFNDPVPAGSTIAGNDYVNGLPTAPNGATGYDDGTSLIGADPSFVAPDASAPDLRTQPGSVAGSLGAYAGAAAPTATPTSTATATATAIDTPVPTATPPAGVTFTPSETPAPTDTPRPALAPGGYTVETTIRTTSGVVVAHYWSQFVQH